MVGHKRERVLGRVGRAVNAAARDFAREAAQLENGGGREAAAERLVEQQVEVVALDKDRVVVETAMRLDVAVAGLVGEGLAGLPARLFVFIFVERDETHEFGRNQHHVTTRTCLLCSG